MKKLSNEGLPRVVRELCESPALIRWFQESEQELYKVLARCSASDFQEVQGQLHSITQVLDKVPKE